MDEEWRQRFSEAPVARLATVSPRGAPRIVPIVFVLLGDGDHDVLWSPVDDKPKSTRALRRLADIESSPRASVLVDHYADDWAELWWVRADGTAAVQEAHTPNGVAAVSALRDKYPQERDAHLGPLVRVEVDTWRCWSAT